jgi:hypothetical protein
MRNPKIGKRGQSPVVPAYLDEVCVLGMLRSRSILLRLRLLFVKIFWPQSPDPSPIILSIH